MAITIDAKKGSKKASKLDKIRQAHTDIMSKNHLSENMEDYLEVIYELIQQKGYATAADISECLNVKPPSVTKMMRRLDKMGYLIYERYRGIKLTQSGEDVAKDISSRHSLLSEFLQIIGVDEKTADRDAERIEHCLEPTTLIKLKDFVKKMEN